MGGKKNLDRYVGAESVHREAVGTEHGDERRERRLTYQEVELAHKVNVLSQIMGNSQVISLTQQKQSLDALVRT